MQMISRPTFDPGDIVLRREVLHGQLWMEHPVTVIDDRGDEFAVLLQPGSPFTFHDHPQGVHPWAGQSEWRGPEVLQLYRVGLWYWVWLFFDQGRFRNWYINFEAPVVGDEGGFDTDDYGLVDRQSRPRGRLEGCRSPRCDDRERSAQLIEGRGGVGGRTAGCRPGPS
jgi:hypothetical protein